MFVGGVSSDVSGFTDEGERWLMSKSFFDYY